MKNLFSKRNSSVVLLLVLTMTGYRFHAQELDRPPAIDEVNYAPMDEEVVTTNPPAFIWLPIKEVKSYFIQYSQSHSFESEKTTNVRDIDITVHIPAEILNPGKWYWRYGYKDGNRDKFGRTRSFEIPKSATVFPFIPGDEVIKRVQNHRPRLTFSPELVKEIRSDTKGRFDYITKKVIREAEDILKMNEPLFAEPDPWIKSSDPRYAYVNAWRDMRPYTQRMVTCALAYLYSGDNRFGIEAKRRLMHFMDWDIEGTSTCVGNDELGMDIAENAPPVFDWIYPVLSDSERQKCIKVLSARMHQISYRVHRARPMETRPFASHQGRMIGFVMEGSIVLAHDVPEAADWLDYTLKLLWSMYPAWGHSDGGWHEGISYWSSYMGRMFRVVAELNRLGVPLKDKPFFRNTGYYGLYAAYPNRQTKAFGDIHEFPVGIAQGELMYILSSLYSNPYFLWHAKITGAAHPTDRDAFLYKPTEITPLPPDNIPQSRAFRDIGLVTMHNNMAVPENNVTILFQSNPMGAISHNFACQNAFIIEAYGEPLAISTGSRQLYGSPHHSEWMWHTKAHNSILVDNIGQVIRNRNSNGKIISYEENGDYVYTAGDATQAYGRRLEKFQRNMLYIRPNYIVIIDDLQTSGKHSTFQWLLHSPCEFNVDTGNNVIVNRSGNVRLTTRMLTPQDLLYKMHSGFTPQVEDSTLMHNQFHLTVSATNPSVTKQFVTLMCIDRTTGPSVEKPLPPTTPRHELKIKDIEELSSLNKTLLKAELLDAEGGIAIRLGNDLILWKEKDKSQVKTAEVVSVREMEIRKNYFINQ